ncbi:sigma-54-dependent transcriptional regulator [Flavobacterium sp. SM2513]|uniref:sigma-54-dependent transcriptional regulator n=1 Tax=Flavobacterium sp. SM2513 TaxID=3424766 RepID=UPI003D7F3E00
MLKILVIEDDVAFCKLVEKFLTKNGYEVSTSFSAAEAKTKIATTKFDLILTDLRLPDSDGMTLLSEFTKDIPSIPVVLMTGYSDINTAVKAIKNGAADYISKPFNPDEVLIVVANALKANEVVSEPKQARAKKATNVIKESNSEFVLGISPASLKLAEYIKLVSPTDISVLIIGESGTGKEVIAQKIHQNSQRNREVFIAVDCGTTPKDLAASEFFGHIKGSFTGALNDKVGYFEAANGGTIFLDEIGNLSYENQVQLLRALQERKIKPVGSTKEIAVDIRIITATNEDLREAVKIGDFREDLYHRINEFSITSPSLKDRKEDLLIFAEFFLEKANQQLNREIIGFSDEVIQIFQNYSWAGNLREMQNVVKRSTLLTTAAFIERAVLPSELFLVHPEKDEVVFSLSQNEKEAIIQALEQTQNNKSEAAKLLKINRKTLYNKLKLYNLEY